jgi:ketosteroid isomerase-like protein
VRAIAGTLLLALVMSACQQRGADSSADRAAVDSAVARYRQAWISGDTAAALARVSDDIRIYISGIPDVVGKDATRKVFLDEMATYDVAKLDLNRQDLIVSGDYAVDIGRYEEIQVPKTGAPIHGEGRYMTMWRREGKDWRIVRYMLNELPPKPRS